MLLKVGLATFLIAGTLTAVPTARDAVAPVERGAAVPSAQGFDPATYTVDLQPVARGFRAPIGFAVPGDGSGRLFVVEKAGRVRIVENGQVHQQPFLDISPIVKSDGSEQGMLGLTFHPRYWENGYFYVHFSDLRGDTHIARYTVSADSNVADPGTAMTVFQADQPYANHNGGHLAFGPDGYLWIGLGDGGGGGDPQNNAQNPATPLGKMLRLDMDSAEPYAIPVDNPFVGVDGALPEIWATGLRNPWRYSFDRATGDLYIADVGQNAWEEVNVTPWGTPGGLNYGWNRTEGNHCFRASACDTSGFAMPVAEYDRSGGCSVTGGYVYRGTEQPVLDGVYLYGDYCTGNLWALWRPDGINWHSERVAQRRVQISSFGEDEAGELYVTGMGDGILYRVVAVAR